MMTAKAARRKDLSGQPATMTHQHYRAIAAMLRTMDWELVLADGGRLAPERMAREVANALEDTNPNFDRARFLAACQPTGDDR